MNQDTGLRHGFGENGRYAVRTFGKPPARRSDPPTKACKKNEKHREELKEEQQDKLQDEHKEEQREKQQWGEEDTDEGWNRKTRKSNSPNPKGQEIAQVDPQSP